MGVLLVVAVSLLVIFIGKWYLQHRKFTKLLKKFPGPPPLPLVGNALDLRSTTALLPKFLEYSQKYGGMVKLHLGPTPTVLLVTDYDFLELLLSSTKIIEKGAEYRFISSWLGSGLILASGDKWRKHRKIITPAFHFKILEQFLEVFHSNTEILIDKFNKELHTPSFDVHLLLKLCMLDIISETAMGISVNAQKDPNCEYLEKTHRMCQVLMIRWFAAFIRYDFLYKFTKLYQEEKQIVKDLHEYTDSVVRKRKLELSNKESEKITEGKTKTRLAFLDLLLEESAVNHNLTDKEIREEVDNFIFAGHDTTAATMSYVLHCLAENQDVQEKAVEELQEIFARDKNRHITLRDLNDMKYLEMVIKETLRVYPTVPFFARNVHEDTPYGDTVIPKGTTIIVNIGGIHRNPEIYPEPEKFNPERFSAENTIDRQPFAYIPFSAGPRNCVGLRFAMLEMKSTLCTILKNFKILPANPKHNLVLSAEGVLVSNNGVRISLEGRNL